MGAVYQRSSRDALYAAAVVIGSLVGLNWGLIGVALGVLVALIIYNFVSLRLSIKLLGCPPSEYIKAQLPGLIIALLVACVALPVRSLLHSYGSPDWFSLIVTTLVCGLSVLGFFFWQPQKIMGVYGMNALVMVFQSIPVRFFPKVLIRWFNTRIFEGVV
jgi:PST family polysaccharide transporter